MILGSKGRTQQLGEGGDWGMCLETQKLMGTMKGHLSGGTKKRVSEKGWECFLLVVPPKPGAELHEGCEGISSGGWQGHVGLKHPFQQCQHCLFLYLWKQRKQVGILGPALPPWTS